MANKRSRVSSPSSSRGGEAPRAGVAPPAERCSRGLQAGGALWFEPFLEPIRHGVTQFVVPKGGLIYTEGQEADAVYFVKKGRVRRSVRSKAGQEAILGALAPGGFCGDGCLAGQASRVSTVTAVAATTVVKVEKAVLAKALHEAPPFSKALLARALRRTIAVEKGMCGQLFNHTEKRLARALLKRSQFGQIPASAHGYAITPKISEAALAKEIGAPRSQVQFFMNKFHRLGLIEGRGEIRVHAALLTDVVLGD